jgi:adenosine 3'-phospho 5'-phosphosulfate transporter B2
MGNAVSYPLWDYIEAFLLTAGVTSFTLTQKTSKSSQTDSWYGVGLLAMYLLGDSFTSQFQSSVYKKHKIDSYQMMLGVNIWSMIITGVSMAFSGDFLSSWVFILSDSEAFYHMFILSLTAASGQLFLYYTLQEYGPVTLTIIMTVRQVLSLFVSCLLFGHPLDAIGWISVIFVFILVFNRAYRKSGAGGAK